MRFRRLPFINASDRTIIVRPDNNKLGTRCTTASVPSDATVGSIVDAVDGALHILEDSRNSLREPMMQLAASAEALAAMAKALSERPVEVQPVPLPAGDELKTAIDHLTAKIEQVGSSTFRPTAAFSVELQELHELLKEFE